MLYQIYELQHALLTPSRVVAELVRTACQNPWNPLSYTQAGRTIAAGAEVFERVTRRFGEPDWGLHVTEIDGKKVDVVEETIVEKPFCQLLHFKRAIKRKDPRVLIVAPMSGHYATLLRGTVEALLPHHDVYITDWSDARQVPLKSACACPAAASAASMLARKTPRRVWVCVNREREREPWLTGERFTTRLK